MLRFYIDKIKFLACFAWWREWGLFRDEWRMTRKDLCQAREDWPRLEREALGRLLDAVAADDAE